jgi:hypothetical protein
MAVLFFPQAVSFNRLGDELESWMDEVETQLSSEDHGKDIISVSTLLKKHQVQYWCCVFIIMFGHWECHTFDTRDM